MASNSGLIVLSFNMFVFTWDLIFLVLTSDLSVLMLDFLAKTWDLPVTFSHLKSVSVHWGHDGVTEIEYKWMNHVQVSSGVSIIAVLSK